jgi:L-alanine-DL-glutamate epimerase-like enolase superfamily enzyme
LKLQVGIERWPLVTPLRIAGYMWEFAEVVVVSLEKNGLAGRGEAAGVYYKNETPASMLHQIEAVRGVIEAGVSRDALQTLLPAGGARNALDSALWDLEAKQMDCPAWQIAGLAEPKPLLTTFTCGAASPTDMAATARGYEKAKAIKLKLTGEAVDVDRVLAVRATRPDVWLGVDANQAYTRASLEKLLPTLCEANVRLLEQPFPRRQDAWLDGFQSPIPVGADESVQTLGDIRGLVGRFAVMNIKLDKCGGLTEGLAMARAGRELGLETMVGSMLGTSLAMAPGVLLGQLCSVVDLDGAIFLKQDRVPSVSYGDGHISCPAAVWGHA